MSLSIDAISLRIPLTILPSDWVCKVAARIDPTNQAQRNSLMPEKQ
jgi:hypothetical protein